MSAERIIGVDFGTSTSVIRVKRYLDGEPIGDRLGTDKVTFNMGSTMVPTLIQKLPTGEAYFGYDAEIPRRKTTTFQNFKVDIENPDEGIRRQARELTVEYFTYLAKSYRAQSEGGHLGESGDKERTIISYPVKWSDETKAFMVQTAKDAGFPNVEGVDEAQAAIQAVTVQNADLLTRKGYFKDGVPVNILLIDMGAGTTDLVLCRHTPGTYPRTDTLGTWPQGGNALFGGREVDELLNSYIRRLIPEENWGQVQKRVGIEQYKSWKEDIVSPALQRMEKVDAFTALDNRLEDLDIEIEYSIDRDSFEQYASDYLRQLPELVRGCVSAAGLSGNDVDLVILTGGHSQWYFVREMLGGGLDRFGEIALKKVQADPERIIPITLPQETVALGLAYVPPRVETPAGPQPVEDDEDNNTPSSIVVVSKGAEDDVFPLKYDPYSRPVISAGDLHIVGVKKNGTVLAFGVNGMGQCNVSDWRDIVAIAAGRDHTVGLKKDGTVVAVGGNEYGQCNVSNWRGIVAIAAGRDHTVGLKKDGTVIATKRKRHVVKFSVHNWQDIVAIAAGGNYTMGLKRDGTIISTEDGDYYNYYRAANSSWRREINWRNITSIALGDSHAVGLKKDGQVIAGGYNRHGQCDVNNWRDVVAIAAGDSHTVGLKNDGTVIAVGNNDLRQCNVNDWRDIVAIAAGGDYTVGLKKDGTVVVAGQDGVSRRLAGWKLF